MKSDAKRQKRKIKEKEKEEENGKRRRSRIMIRRFVCMILFVWISKHESEE